MLSPLDLQKIEFAKKLGGYKKSDVDDIFEVIKRDYETLFKENIELKDKIEILDSLVNKYKAMEDTMQNALIVAQSAADNIRRAAEEKAEAIKKEAEMTAEAMRLNAQRDISEMLGKKEKLAMEMAAFRARMEAALDAQKKLLMQIQEDGER